MPDDAVLPLSPDPRPAFGECAEVARAVVAAVAPEDADRPTPADMPVGELVPHLVMAVRRAACLGRGEPLETWPVDAPDVTLDSAADLLVAASDDAVAAWRDDDSLTALRPLPWDPSTLGAEALAVYVGEVLLHTWDLARGLDVPVTWSEATVDVVLAVMRKQLPVAERGPIWDAVAQQFGAEPGEFEPPFADAVPVPDDASHLDQLLGWTGRRP